MADTVSATRFRVEGMDCAACATKVDTAVRRVAGVTDVSVSVTAGTMVVQHEAGSNLSELEKQVNRLGYKTARVGPADGATKVAAAQKNHDQPGDPEHSHAAPIEGPWWQSPKARLTLLCGVAVGVASDDAVNRFRPARLPVAQMRIPLRPRG